MSLVCPECKTASFKIVDSVECGPDAGADENTVQRAHCPECGTFFLCVYKAVRSFRSDRDDRVTHLAFVTDQGLWNGSARIFEKPTSRVSSQSKIAAAMSVLRMAQEAGVSGQHIVYAPVSVQRQNVQPEEVGITGFMPKLKSWFWKKMR